MTDPRFLTELPQCSKTILSILNTPMTSKQISEATKYTKRTVYYGIRYLKEQKLVSRKLNMQDTREIIYSRVVKGVEA